jgi:hypothetical protein
MFPSIEKKYEIKFIILKKFKKINYLYFKTILGGKSWDRELEFKERSIKIKI